MRSNVYNHDFIVNTSHTPHNHMRMYYCRSNPTAKAKQLIIDMSHHKLQERLQTWGGVEGEGSTALSMGRWGELPPPLPPITACTFGLY